MSMVDDIAILLQSNGIVTLGTDLFINYVPDSPDNCTVITQYPGRTPEHKKVADIIRPSLQVRVRDKSDQAASDKIESIESVLHGIANQRVNGVWYLSITAVQSPSFVGRDEKNRSEYVQNYNITLERGV